MARRSTSSQILPDWMNNLKTATGTGDEELDLENGTRYSLRRRDLSKTENINRHEQENYCRENLSKNYPYINYKGRIKYDTEMVDIASSSNQLLQWVNRQIEPIIPIAFDMEWPFSFKTGPGKSAVIQICADINLCYIFHLTKLKRLPLSLLELLTHDRVRLHGVNIKCDFRKLQRDFPEANAQKMIDQSVDLSTLCNNVMDTSGRWSMERLVLYICKLRINKEGSVRCSRWDIIPLTKVQQTYAAIDVYIGQVIYLELQDRAAKKEQKLREFEEKYGTDALKAVMNLK